MSQTIIYPSEHLFIAGKTGSGKSYLAEVYTSCFNRVTMLDTKNEKLDTFEERLKKNQAIWLGVENKDLAITDSFDDYKYLFKNGYNRIIYSPSFEENNKEMYDEFFQFQYLAKNNTTWIDELMQVNDSAHTIPNYLKALYTRGRSRLSNVIACTQRPSGINQLCISSSTHVFGMNLLLPQDREKLTDITGAQEFLLKIPDRYFHYWHDGWEHAKYGILQ